MQAACLDILMISRYVQHDAELEEVLRVERHVRGCARCRDKLTLMKRHGQSLFDDYLPGRQEPLDACPSRIQLDHYGRASLHERQMVRLQEHLNRCETCRLRIFGQHGRSTRTSADRDAAGAARTWRPLLATCRAHLDLRLAPEGVRIASGAALLDRRMPPSMLLRLGLTGLELQSAAATAARRLEFEKQHAGWTLRVCVELASPEGFRLGVGVVDAAGPCSALELWTRTRVWGRSAVRCGRWACEHLLLPGHYFVGPSAYETPWLALSVEEDLLTPLELAEVGYDQCCRGRFHAALRCFEAASQQSSGPAAYRSLLQHTWALATRFGLADADREIFWRSPQRTGALPEPAALDLAGPGAGSVDRVAELVGALRRRAELSVRDDPPALGAARHLSRRAFRPAYATLMRRLRRLLEGLHRRPSTAELTR
ncbi:MAG: hypothetical protein ACE5G2_08370 [Candidatus Krumholzibacteriia bacterium]